MFSYLHGWRRKMGCVVLVMAAVVMVGWNRSKSVGESVSFPSGLDTTDCFVSVDCSILWVKCDPGFFEGLLNLPKFEQHDFDPRSDFYHIFALREVDWIWRLFGYGVGEVPAERGAHGRRFTFWIIPYWAVFISLSVSMVISRSRFSTREMPMKASNLSGNATRSCSATAPVRLMVRNIRPGGARSRRKAAKCARLRK